MAYTQNALVGGMVIVNMFGYALGRSGIHRYIRHDYISFLADEGHYQFSGAALWPIPLPGPLVLFWANHQFLMGLIGVSIPILLALFLIAKERYVSGWISLLLFTVLYFGTGAALWVDSVFGGTW